MPSYRVPSYSAHLVCPPHMVRLAVKCPFTAVISSWVFRDSLLLGHRLLWYCSVMDTTASCLVGTGEKSIPRNGITQSKVMKKPMSFTITLSFLFMAAMVYTAFDYRNDSFYRWQN